MCWNMLKTSRWQSVIIRVKSTQWPSMNIAFLSQFSTRNPIKTHSTEELQQQHQWPKPIVYIWFSLLIRPEIVYEHKNQTFSILLWVFFSTLSSRLHSFSRSVLIYLSLALFFSCFHSIDFCTSRLSLRHTSFSSELHVE